MKINYFKYKNLFTPNEKIQRLLYFKIQSKKEKKKKEATRNR